MTKIGGSVQLLHEFEPPSRAAAMAESGDATAGPDLYRTPLDPKARSLGYLKPEVYAISRHGHI